MASLTVEAPVLPVKKGTHGQIIVSTSSKSLFAAWNGLQVDIESIEGGNCLIWRGSTVFKNGSATLDLDWPGTAGHYQILAKSVNFVGAELDFVTKLFEVID